MSSQRILVLACAALLTAVAPAEGFFDTADTVNPGWVTDRYDPNAFATESFMGENVYRMDSSTADSFNNRPASYQSSFYNYQGKKRDTFVTGPGWIVSADVYVSSDFLSGNELRDAEIWARDDAALEADAYYPSFGIVRDRYPNLSDFSAGPGLTTQWEMFNPNTGDIDASSFNVTEGWHNLAILADATSFSYLVDGTTIGSYARDASANPNLRSVFLQTYSFSNASNPGSSYVARFDNVRAAPVPEPASLAALGLGAVGLLRRRARRA